MFARPEVCARRFPLGEIVVCGGGDQDSHKVMNVNLGGGQTVELKYVNGSSDRYWALLERPASFAGSEVYLAWDYKQIYQL